MSISPFRNMSIVSSVEQSYERVKNLRSVYGDNTEPSCILEEVSKDLGISFCIEQQSDSFFSDTLSITVNMMNQNTVISVPSCHYKNEEIFYQAFGFGLYYNLLSQKESSPFILHSLSSHISIDDVTQQNAEALSTALFLIIPTKDVQESIKNFPSDEIAQALYLCKKYRSYGIDYYKALLRIAFEETAHVSEPDIWG